MGKEDGKVLGEDGPKRKRLVIRLTEYKDHRLLDLRYWYLDKKADEFKPTSKGIMLTRSNYLAFKKVVDHNHETVMDWLGVGYVPEHVEKYNREQEKNVEDLRLKSSEVRGEISDCPEDTSFFKVEHEGGVDRVVFNSSHPFVRLMQDNKDQCIDELVLMLVMTFERAKNGLEGTSAIDSNILFDQLEYDWSDKLRYLVKNK